MSTNLTDALAVMNALRLLTLPTFGWDFAVRPDIAGDKEGKKNQSPVLIAFLASCKNTSSIDAAE